MLAVLVDTSSNQTQRGDVMIYTLYIHDKAVIWSSRIEVINENLAALGSLAQWCRVESRES